MLAGERVGIQIPDSALRPDAILVEEQLPRIETQTWLCCIVLFEGRIAERWPRPGLSARLVQLMRQEDLRQENVGQEDVGQEDVRQEDDPRIFSCPTSSCRSCIANRLIPVTSSKRRMLSLVSDKALIQRRMPTRNSNVALKNRSV